MTRVVFDSNIIGPWVCAHGGGEWDAGAGTEIGLCTDNGKIEAGVIYDNYNGANVMAHIAGIGNWASNRKFLWIIFDYPFNQLKVNRITVPVAESNRLARKFVERLGFELEYEAKDAHPSGSLFIYKMMADRCRWLVLKGKHYG